MSGGTPLDPYALKEFGGGGFVRNKSLDMGRTLIAPKFSTVGLLMLVCIGQSLGANTCSGDYTCANPTLVANFNPYDGANYTAVNPLLGPTGDVGDLISPGVQKYSNQFIRVADKIITAGFASRVLIANVNVGGTSISSWAGTLKDSLLQTLQRLQQAGYDPQTLPTAICQQQGTADRLMIQATYQGHMETMMNYIRGAGWTNPKWIVAKETRNNTDVGTGQPAAVDALAALHPTYFFVGPDTDTILPVDRYDNVHLNGTGADTNAGLWTTALDAVF